MTDMPDPSHLRRTGHRIMPAEVWDQARDDYLRGESGPDVCRRYGLPLSTFRGRAASGGWRRTDQPPPSRRGPIEIDGDLEDASAWDLREMAWIHLREAVADGLATEAARWLRIHERLTHEVDMDARQGDSDCSYESDPVFSATESEINR